MCKMKRLPNGFGSIKKLSGSRRRPFIAVKNNVIVGYYTTYNEAFADLARLQDKEVQKNQKITFAQAYNLMMEEMQLGEGAVKKRSSMFKNYCKPLHKKTLESITINDLEQLVSTESVPRTCVGRLKTTLGDIWSYGVRHQLIDRNIVNDCIFKVRNETEKKRVPFTFDELNTLRSTDTMNLDAPVWAIMQVLLWTGMRPAELFKVKPDEVHLDDDAKCWYLVGGSKTDNGKNRVIPLVKVQVVSIIEQWCDDAIKNNREFIVPIKYPQFTRRWLKLKESLGIDHEPYDCRHHFQTACYRCNIAEHITNLVVGHRDKSLTLRVYTHISAKEIYDGLANLDIFKGTRQLKLNIRLKNSLFKHFIQTDGYFIVRLFLMPKNGLFKLRLFSIKNFRAAVQI